MCNIGPLALMPTQVAKGTFVQAKARTAFPGSKGRRRLLRSRRGRRNALTVLLALAFTFQSFVADVHFHFPAEYGSAAARAAPLDSVPLNAAGETGDHGGKPLGAGDPSSHCPLCQLLAAGGTALSSHVSVLFAQVLSGSKFNPTEFESLFGGTAVSYSWESRAPPLR
jgi:Protein of unknown function (DUF2946)